MFVIDLLTRPAF
uniref:Uncharacterized protein n=1 Tax=Anopheles dirus TaxID=7168 RepID=A0A182NWH5_9DIPT